jgi:hypothetical protein
MHAMVVYSGDLAELHIFLNSAVDKRGCFDLSSTFVSSEKVSSFPIIREGGLPYSRLGRFEKYRNFFSFP